MAPAARSESSMSGSGGLTQAAQWVWANWDAIKGRLSALREWFRGKKHERGILILGTGGAGKTTLAKLLSGKYDWLLENPGRYEESIGIEKYSLKGKPSLEVVVPPGQQHRRETTWSDLRRDIGAGRFRGIILLAAYGYDTLGQIDIQHHRLYAGDRREFLDAYLEDRRRDELSVLQALSPHLLLSPGKLWMFTLIAKQDLWWDKRVQVEHYYRHGEYGQVLQRLTGQQDPQRFRHELAFASLVISNFNTAKGDCLKKNVAGYDQQLQVESLRRLFQTVDALKDWEAAK
jgi:hypothetical protein